MIGGKQSFRILENEIDKKNINILKIILESLKIKKTLIQIDEYDRGKRNIFNYGHTFGHAIESVTNYKIPHGIAVSMGMDIANFYSVNQKFLDNKTRNKIKMCLSKIWNKKDFKKISVLLN